MEIQTIVAFIETKRVDNKLHKATLCSKAEISVTYYNNIIAGTYTPSYTILKALLKVLGYSFMLVPSELVRL